MARFTNAAKPPVESASSTAQSDQAVAATPWGRACVGRQQTVYARVCGTVAGSAGALFHRHASDEGVWAA